MATEIIKVPDLGGAEEVEVIEIPIAVGDTVALDDTLVVLESDKATMEIPASKAGKIIAILVTEGQRIDQEGVPLVEIEVSGDEEQAASVTEAKASADTQPSPSAKTTPAQKKPTTTSVENETDGVADAVVADVSGDGDRGDAANNGADQKAAANEATTRPQSADTLPAANGNSPADGDIYAGPAVRQLARELGVELRDVSGTGPRGRLLKDDVHTFVKQRIKAPQSGGAAVPGVPDIDFGQFGEVEQVAMTKIGKLTAANMHRSWLNVPHVTQFDDADITELEVFRQSLKAEGERRGTKMTPVPIILKACAVALANNPVLNRALHSAGEYFFQKHYIHIGIAVDTPRGLVVPVVRDVNKKPLWQLAAEVAELADKARDGKLTVNEMQGGCFTISSLGAIGGKGFTPIVNTPEVAILGVSKARIKPLWNGREFEPRNMLPLSLSYDHRMVNGGDAGRFMTDLVALLGDIRRLLL